MMGNVTTICLDIAKSVFQVHGVDAASEVVVRRKLTHGRVLAFFEGAGHRIEQDKASDR
ncbi:MULTISPECIES: hypothetical protein [unclassified Mesorhizobium]|uniref:hypothetical protein n=1 Tax=Mesorhizobium sp. B2-5-7 TaxID=2589923 RepID=UPI0015E45A79|nr:MULTISPECIES: hypothetical protein [unclassified Mesorhizobium]MBZ9973861.1 hypothetical protein [Mesorhizobium sp. BR-1-1-10]